VLGFRELPVIPEVQSDQQQTPEVRRQRSAKTSNPYLADGMNYAQTGELITSWIDIGMVNANKFWHELTINAENLDSDTYITCYYQTDTDTVYVLVQHIRIISYTFDFLAYLLVAYL